MVERQNPQQHIRIDGSRPSERRETVRLMLAIAQPTGIGVGIGIRIVGNLVVILAQLRHQTKLVLRIQIVKKSSDPAVAILGVVKYLANGSLQPKVAAICIDTRVVRELLGVPAKI